MLVSTIIPTYNRSRDVCLAIDSALAQTYAHQEILVVDDGSTDDTAAVLRARYGDRIRYLPKPNGGVSSARNWGLEHARGEVVAFLDSDDQWLPEKLALQMEILARRPEIDMVLCNITEVDGEGKPTGRPYNRRTVVPVDGWVFPYVLRNGALCPSTAIVRTHVARAVGGFDTGLRTAEDIDFHVKVAFRHKIANVDRALILYTRAAGSLGSELRTYRDYVFVIERFIAEHAGEIARDDRREAELLTYLRNARGLAHCGAIDGAARLVGKSLLRARRPRDLAAIGELGAIVALHAVRKARARIAAR